jgi:hypothetical protein
VTGGIAIAATPVASGLASSNDARLANDISGALKADSIIEIVNALTDCVKRRPGEPLEKIA